MVVIDSKDCIIGYEKLSENEKKDLMSYFEYHNGKGIIELENHKYCTYEQLKKGLEPSDIRIAYNPDMFYESHSFIADYGYAIATDAESNEICVLRWEATTYAHSYIYSGGADMWFLDQYDCLFLHGCNEFSVELYMSALRLWKGQQVVFVGSDWLDLIPQLPDYPGVECYYEEVLTEENLLAFYSEKLYLHIVTGCPHEEKIDRYDNRIAYYDEVMSFTFMFSNYQEKGTENSDKSFFVVDGMYANLGLFALYNKAEVVARYAKSRGFIPVIRITNGNGSIYSNFEGDDIWGKFYNQPEQYTLGEVMNSKNVYFAPVFYNGSVQSTIMNRCAGQTTLSWPNGIYNDKVWAYINERQEKFLPYPERTLGVLARGTDFVNAHLHNHAIHATKEMIGDKIDEVWDLWGGFEYVYIATEDASYSEYFKERYGEKVLFTDQERFITRPNEMLAEMHRKNTKKRDGFQLGVEYILSIYLLSKCKSFIASGGCSGVREALKENDGKYEKTFVFQLGLN